MLFVYNNHYKSFITSGQEDKSFNAIVKYLFYVYRYLFFLYLIKVSNYMKYFYKIKIVMHVVLIY